MYARVNYFIICLYYWFHKTKLTWSCIFQVLYIYYNIYIYIYINGYCYISKHSTRLRQAWVFLVLGHGKASRASELCWLVIKIQAFSIWTMHHQYYYNKDIRLSLLIDIIIRLKRKPDIYKKCIILWFLQPRK